MPQRRDGDNRLVREADDILSLFTCLDENKLLNQLPRYVADGPDSLPPIRLYEGELNGVLQLIKKLSDKVDEYSSALSEVTRELRQLQARCVPVSDRPTATVQCDQQRYQQHRQTDKPGKSVGSYSARQQPSGNSSVATTEQSAVRRTVDTRDFDPAPDVNVRSDWATMASTPNRFAVLSTDDDERNDNDVLNQQAFTTVVHRRNKRNRTSPEAATSAQPQPGQACTTSPWSTGVW